MTSVTQRNTPLILVADDDESTRMMLEQALIHAGYDVIMAVDGQSATEQFADKEPDLVLLDVNMPIADGYTACANIRKNHSSRHTPIIMMTSADDVQAVTRSFQSGATDFVTKPINWPLFIERVRYALRNGELALQLQENQERLEAAHRIAKMGHFEYDLTTHIFTCSAYLREVLLETSDDDITDLASFLRYIHPDHAHAFASAIRAAPTIRGPISLDHCVVRKNGVERFVYTRAEPVLDRNHQAVRLLGIMHDVTERMKTEQRLNFLTYHDDLTGLPNRTLFQDWLRKSIQDADRAKHQIAIMVLDLDRFKTINDSLGHDAGNIMLQTVAQRISSTLSKSDIAARTGSDEFLLGVSEIHTSNDAMLFAQRIMFALEAPFRISDQDLFVTASLGIAIYPTDGQDIEALIRDADAAMHQAKQSGRNTFQFYQSEMNAGARQRLSLEARLRQALAKDEFILCYQPQVNLLEHKVHGAEALIRWRDEKRGLIPPMEFIPLLEETGLIVPVGAWVLRSAAVWLHEWHQRGLKLNVSVNVSARQFHDPHFIDTVMQIIEETGASPHHIEIELTESTLMANEAHAIELLNTLKSVGFKLAIDDFGTGYSSLSYLKKLPVDYLKVDKSFVLNMATDQNDLTIVRSTIDLAHNLGLKVIAEGIENPLVIRLLRDMRCELAQGFLIGHPLFVEQFAPWYSGYMGIPLAAPVT